MKQKYLAILLGAIIVLGGAYLYFNKNTVTAPETSNENINVPPTEGSENNVPESTNTAGNVTGTNTIVVSTQIANTKTVTIDNANLSKPGFIVIMSKATNTDQPDRILGTSGYLSAGVKQDLEINLTNSTLLEGAKYTAAIYVDDGDKKFDSSKDQPVGTAKSSTTFSAQ